MTEFPIETQGQDTTADDITKEQQNSDVKNDQQERMDDSDDIVQPIWKLTRQHRSMSRILITCILKLLTMDSMTNQKMNQGYAKILVPG